jgi:8-oxo-dGTP diphosphatase
VYKKLADIEWAAWTPQERATLLFVVRDGEMLLIHKKRGLGAGKINGPGGHIEPGETPWQAAIREVQEELRVTPFGAEESGELFFQFADGLALHVNVFKAPGCDGDPQETDEATPLWVPLNAIPYARMWPDDPFWLPLMLAGRPFRGYFLFDGERMLDRRVEAPSPSTARTCDVRSRS